MPPIDLQYLQSYQIYSDTEGVKWLTYTRRKSIITANVPLLSPAIQLLIKYDPINSKITQKTCFQKVTNQDINKVLKMIGEICEIGMPLNFYMAKHTFATTVTLEQGVPITTIKAMMGHEKIESTMNYARAIKSIVAISMIFLDNKISDLKV